MTPSTPDASPNPPSGPTHHRDGRFHNARPRPSLGFWQGLKLTWSFLFGKPAGTVPDQPIPVRPLTRAELGLSLIHI